MYCEESATQLSAVYTFKIEVYRVFETMNSSCSILMTLSKRSKMCSALTQWSAVRKTLDAVNVYCFSSKVPLMTTSFSSDITEVMLTPTSTSISLSLKCFIKQMLMLCSRLKSTYLNHCSIVTFDSSQTNICAASSTI